MTLPARLKLTSEDLVKSADLVY